MAEVFDRGSPQGANLPDMEAFRLRRFIDRLIEQDLAEIHDRPSI